MRHERKLWRTKVIAVFTAVLAGFSCFINTDAGALKDAQDKKNQAQNELDSANQQIEAIEQKQQELQAQIQALDAELVDVILNLDILETELEDKQVQLDQVTAQLAQAEEDERVQYDLMVKRIVYIYENGGDSSYLSVITGAGSFTDLLNRVEYARQIHEYDRNLLVQFQETVQQVTNLKAQVETEQQELMELQQSYQEQKSEFETMIAERQEQLSDFDTQLASAQDLAAQMRATIDQQNDIIRQEEERRLAAAAAQQNQNNNHTVAGNNSGGNNHASENPGNGAAPEGNGNAGGGTETNEGEGSGGGANPPHTTSVSGSDVVAFACQYIGNPYVWGGESLTNGADCSGFIKSVYANYGINLPHSSLALQRVGSEVSYGNAQPGDIICYAGHVAIYMGGGQIVHASSPETGIKTGSATYRQILTVRRVL